jgi:hypothetical protein
MTIKHGAAKFKCRHPFYPVKHIKLTEECYTPTPTYYLQVQNDPGADKRELNISTQMQWKRGLVCWVTALQAEQRSTHIAELPQGT